MRRDRARAARPLVPTTWLMLDWTILAVIALAIPVTAIWANVVRTEEARTTDSLRRGIPGADVEISDRIKSEYVYQTCLDIIVRPRDGSPTKRQIVMIDGGDDGGFWTLRDGEYDDMRECQDAFFRG